VKFTCCTALPVTFCLLKFTQIKTRNRILIRDQSFFLCIMLEWLTNLNLSLFLLLPVCVFFFGGGCVCVYEFAHLSICDCLFSL